VHPALAESSSLRDAFFYTKDAGSSVDQMEMGDEVHANSTWCEALYEERAAGLILYGRALGLSHAESEDVVQETFLALMQLPEPPRERVNYCVRAFRNRALNHHRSLWRRLTREPEFQRWFEPSGTETREERMAMRCLAGLPSEQREVIVLKIWNQHTFEEIAQLLEISPNTAAGRYRYGIQKLRACLKGDYDERTESPRDTLSILGSAPAFPET
jgi:RNA polymerase sigma-70 factor (ECF subfamily)